MNLNTSDPVRQLMSDLLSVHSTFEKADEVYREFRSAVLNSPDVDESCYPVEWIPTSDH